MSKFTDNLSEEEFYEEIGEMASFWKEYSKLPYEVLIDSLGRERLRKNNSPRVMISLDDSYREIVPISIDKDNPKVLINRKLLNINIEIIKNWIIKNYEILMKHWNQEISDGEAVRYLKQNIKE